MTSRIPRTRRTVLVGLSAASLVGVAALSGVLAAPAQATGYDKIITIETSGTKVQAVPYGVSGVTTTQQLNGKNCATTTTAGPVLWMSGSPTGYVPGIYGGSIGVAEPKSGNGSSCSQVSVSSEALTVGLEADTTNSTLRSALYAVLDVEVQKDVVVMAQTSLNGVNNGTPFRLYTGTAANGIVKSTYVDTCNVGSTSSNPNSNSSDNCKWQIFDGTRFDKVVLTATSAGQFSLEGGSDWAGGSSLQNGSFPANASYFFLGEGCSTGATTLYISGGGTGQDDASYTRNTSNADGSPCIRLDTELKVDGEDLALLKPLGQPFEQGVVRAPWSAAGGTVAVNDTEINFVPKPTDPDAPDYAAKMAAFDAGWKPMDWCPATLWNGTTGPQILDSRLNTSANAAAAILSGSDNPLTPGIEGYGLEDQDNRVAGTDADNGLFQYSCVFDRDVTRNPSNGTYRTVESIYLLGDAYWRG